MSKEPPFIEIPNVGRAYMRICVIDDDSIPSDIPDNPQALPPLAIKRELYVTQLPFSIGRELKSDDKASAAISEWLYLPSMKISRRHATVRWCDTQRRYIIDSLSKNGIDVNKKHVPNASNATLEPCSLIRVGPCYLFFLLPQTPGDLGKLPSSYFTPSPALMAYLSQKSASDASVSDVASPSVGKRTTKRVSYQYRAIIQRVYDEHILPQYQGFFTVPMLLHYIPIASPNEPLPQERDYIRKSLRQALSRANSGYVQVPPESVPPDVVASTLAINSKRAVHWYARKPETAPEIVS